MIDNDNIEEIIDWLSPRMKNHQKRQLLLDLNIRTVTELKANWDQPIFKDRIKLEIKRHLTASDFKFKLEPQEINKPKKNYYIPKTFIDMTSVDD